PHDASDWNVNGGEDVDRHRVDRYQTQDPYQRRHNDECVGATKSEADNPHGKLPVGALLIWMPAGADPLPGVTLSRLREIGNALGCRCVQKPERWVLLSCPAPSVCCFSRRPGVDYSKSLLMMKLYSAATFRWFAWTPRWWTVTIALSPDCRLPISFF